MILRYNKFIDKFLAKASFVVKEYKREKKSMEENKMPNKSEKDIIKENMLTLYKAYQNEKENPVDEISYYKQIILQSEKSKIMYGLQDVYQVNIKEPEKFYGNRTLLYQNGTPIAMIDENSNIRFYGEYLEQMKALNPSIYALLISMNGNHYELPQIQEVSEKLPNINSKKEVEDFKLSKEELENAKQNEIAGQGKSEEKNNQEEINEQEPENEEKSMEQIAKQSGITKDDIKSCSTIDPHERITDQKSFEDIANVTGKYSKIFVVSANSKTRGNSLYSFWGMTQDGKMEQVKGLEERQGVNTGKSIYSINRDGSQVKEQQTSALFTLPNQREGFSVTIGQYGVIETTYIRRSTNENKYIGSVVNSSTQKPTTREVQEFMNNSRNPDTKLRGTIDKIKHQLGETPETKLRNVDENPNNDVEIDMDQEITLHDGKPTTPAQEAKALNIAPNEYMKQFAQIEADCYADKVELIRKEKAAEKAKEQAEEHEERAEKSLADAAWRRRGIIG